MLDWPQVRKSNAAKRVRRISPLFPFLHQTFGIGLARHFQDRPVHVENTTMITTPDSMLLDAPILKRGSAMLAMQVQHADSAAPVFENDQFFTHDFGAQGGAFNLVQIG